MSGRKERTQTLGIVLCAMLVFYAVGCGKAPASPMAAVYDNEEKLANPYSSYNLDGVKQEIDGTKMKGSYDKLEGMVLLWTYDTKKTGALDVTYRLTVTSGKAKLVYIDPDNQVSTIIECTPQSSMDDIAVLTLSLKEGLSRIKIVGAENTSVKFEISILEGEFLAV